MGPSLLSNFSWAQTLQPHTESDRKKPCRATYPTRKSGIQVCSANHRAGCCTCMYCPIPLLWYHVGSFAFDVPGVSAEVYLAKKISQDTGGTYGVALSESHLEELMLALAPPPPTSAAYTEAELVGGGCMQGGGANGSQDSILNWSTCGVCFGALSLPVALFRMGVTSAAESPFTLFGSQVTCVGFKLYAVMYRFDYFFPSSMQVQMGFPKRDAEELSYVYYVGADCALKAGCYTCPKCCAKLLELPCACHVCGLTLISSPHLARSYHHLFPVQPYRELSAEELQEVSGLKSLVRNRRKVT